MMNPAQAWFDRKFDFSFPVELAPNLISRLRGVPARIEETLRGRSEQILTQKPGEKWSAKEHAGHLVDLEPLWLARVHDYAAGREELTTTDLQNRKTDEARYNDRSLEEIASAFRAERNKLLQQVERVDRPLFARATMHPRLKVPMRLVDHLFFVAEHDDHHLARMWELVGG